MVDDVSLLAPCRDEAHELEIYGYQLRNGTGVKPEHREGEHLCRLRSRIPVIGRALPESIQVVSRFVRDDAGQPDHVAPCRRRRVEEHIARDAGLSAQLCAPLVLDVMVWRVEGEWAEDILCVPVEFLRLGPIGHHVRR